MNDDMLAEIVTRLPLKSFSRSKCVSKSWQSLLSTDYVRNKLPLIVSGVLQPTLKNADSGPSYVLASSNEKLYKPNHFTDDHFPFFRVATLIDSVNGLLLYYSSLTKKYHVCNPTTNKYVELPKPASESKLSVLAFDPYYSRHFKVVSFTAWKERSADIEVFCSETSSWSGHNVRWPGTINTNALSATMRYMGEVLYVLAQPRQCVAIALDEGMECRVIELPESMRTDSCLGVLKGRLSYCSNDGRQVLRVWVMLEESDEWELRHYCEMSSSVGEFRVLGLHPERELVYLCSKERENERLVGYDVCERRVEREWELGDELKGYLVQVWVFPFHKNVEDCLRD